MASIRYPTLVTQSHLFYDNIIVERRTAVVQPPTLVCSVCGERNGNCEILPNTLDGQNTSGPMIMIHGLQTSSIMVVVSHDILK